MLLKRVFDAKHTYPHGIGGVGPIEKMDMLTARVDEVPGHDASRVVIIEADHVEKALLGDGHEISVD